MVCGEVRLVRVRLSSFRVSSFGFRCWVSGFRFRVSGFHRSPVSLVNSPSSLAVFSAVNDPLVNRRRGWGYSQRWGTNWQSRITIIIIIIIIIINITIIIIITSLNPGTRRGCVVETPRMVELNPEPKNTSTGET